MTTRRDFLKLLGIGAAAAPLAASVARAESVPPIPKEAFTGTEPGTFEEWRARTFVNPPRMVPLTDEQRAELLATLRNDSLGVMEYEPRSERTFIPSAVVPPGGSVELVDVGGHHIEVRRFPNGTVMVAEACVEDIREGDMLRRVDDGRVAPVTRRLGSR